MKWELLRYSRSVYGQQVLVGASWDLLWLFVAAGAAVIVLHATYKLLMRSRAAQARDRLTMERALR
jgi:hypothetical protein